jgi:hypothetical protein
MSSGPQSAAPTNTAAWQKAQAKKKADYAAKVKRNEERKKALEKNTSGLYQQWIGQTTNGAYDANGKPLALAGRLLYQGREVTANELLNKFFSWTPAEVNAFDTKIKSLQIRPSDKPIDPDDRRDIYVSAVARASQFYALTKGENKLDGSLEGTLLAYKGLAGTSGSGAANLPSRSINNLSDAAINAIIDQVSQAQLRKKINDPAERAKLVKNIKDQVSQGIVTSTKKVKNTTTGKWENVTTTSGPDVQDIQLQLAEDLKTSHAEDYQLNKTLGFADALTRVMSKGV